MLLKALFMAVMLALVPVHATLAQEADDKAKAEKNGSATALDAQNEEEAEGSKTDKVRLKIREVVIVGDKIGRLAVEAPPSITIVEGEQAEQPVNRHVKIVIRKTANALAEEGPQLPALRGVDGSAGYGQALTAGTQPRIPLLIDDVPRPLMDAFAISRSSTWDVSTMEIARGPQPSSTGRNALGGAIRVYTNNPTFEYEAAARLRGYTADGTADGAAMVNLPLIDNQVAFRATAEESRGDAYIKVTGGTEGLRGGYDPETEIFRRYRGKLLLTPEAVSGLEIKLTVDHMRTAGPNPGFGDVDGDPKNLNVSNFALQNAFEKNDQTTYIGRLNYALNEFADLEIRGSFIDNDLALLDNGSGVGQADFAQNQGEGEAYLRVSDLGVLSRGLIGIIHNTATEDGSTDAPHYVLDPMSGMFFPNVTGASLDYRSDGEIHNTGWYAEAEFALDELGLADGLTLIAGGRYERDDRHRSLGVGGVTLADRSLSARRFQPKVGLRYAPNDDLLLGYTYSEGFRAGGTDVDIFAAFFGLPSIPISKFDPETLSQHEVYAKSSLLNRRVSFGASAFYYTHQDAQLQVTSILLNPLGFPLTTNIPEAVSYGLEIEATADLTAGFSVNGALGLLKTEITDAGPFLQSNEGDELPRAPSTTANLALNYDSGDGFNATLSGRFVGRTTSILNAPEIPSYTILDLSMGHVFQDGGLRVDFFIENLMDQAYFNFRGAGANAFEGKGRPRTFGFSSTWRF